MTITNFVWDDLSDNVLMETDENNVPVVKYTNEPGQFGEVLSQHRHGQDQYFHFDGLGSTRNLTSQNETVTDSYSYTGFGETVTSSGSTPNPFKFNGAFGYYTNAETSDIYVRRRTYAPSIARWLSRDPLTFVDGPNVYFYVGNQAPNSTDPTGNAYACCCCVEDVKFAKPHIPLPTPDNAAPGPDGNFVDVTDFLGHQFFAEFTTNVQQFSIDCLAPFTTPCRLEWNERIVSFKSEDPNNDGWPDNYTFNPKEYGIWYDIAQLQPNLFPEWQTYYALWGNGSAPCPPAPLKKWELPGIGMGPEFGSRTIEWAVGIHSSLGCDCQYSTVHLTARQELLYAGGMGMRIPITRELEVYETVRW